MDEINEENLTKYAFVEHHPNIFRRRYKKDFQTSMYYQIDLTGKEPKTAIVWVNKRKEQVMPLTTQCKTMDGLRHSYHVVTQRQLNGKRKRIRKL